ATGESFTNVDDLPTDPLMPDLEDTADLLNTGIFSGVYDDEDVGAEADLNNLETTMNVSPIPTTRMHKDHPKDQIIGDINSATQTRRMTKIFEEHSMKVTQALTDPSWIEAMQDELLQFRLQKVWRLVDLPKGKHDIGTKWVYRNKKDERGVEVRNKARLVAQGYTQEEGIDYDEVFAHVARIEVIRLFLAYASFMGFIVYEMDVKSAFLYGTIEEEVYVYQPLGFEDPQFPDKVYKVMQRDDGIFISQDKYVADILKKFDFVTMKTASTPIETHKALIKDEEVAGVDVHLYRSMIGSLMYLTASRSDIMFVVCACTRFQVTPKVSHLHAVKRIFRYLKGEANYVNMQSRMDERTCNIKQTYVKSQIPKRGRDTKIPQSGGPPEKVGDEVVHKELGDRMERDATTASSLEAEQDSEGSARFHQIVDFLNSTHIKYALTENPTIYVSLIHQFWQTAFVSTSENEEMEITATIDGRVKHVTEASIRRHLKLEDSDGTLLSSVEGEGSTVLVESHHTPTDAPSNSPPHISPTLRSPIRQETKVPHLSSPPHTNVVDEAASTSVDVRHGGAATTVTSLDAG
ncbi:ribonuclease H-like domain-containing protein, partial [Tanacetum coccineum]